MSMELGLMGFKVKGSKVQRVMAHSAILLRNEIDKLASLGLPLWQRGPGDFKTNFLH
jgi:hypothetical protein